MADRIFRALAVVAIAGAGLIPVAASAGLPAEPSATVDPDTELNERVHVLVKASGFEPGDNVRVVQCLEGADAFQKPRRRPCDRGDMSDGVNANGRVSLRRAVRRYVQDGEGGIVDCADAPGTCVMSLGSYEHRDDATEVPLSFDPDAPFPDPPRVRVTPRRDLVNGQSVLVAGEDFNAESQLGIVQCRAEAPDLNRCLYPATFVNTDADGRFVALFTVTRKDFFASDRTTTNCRTTDCVIRVVNLEDIRGEQAETRPLRFRHGARHPG
jgi:hypothetical protein